MINVQQKQRDADHFLWCESVVQQEYTPQNNLSVYKCYMRNSHKNWNIVNGKSTKTINLPTYLPTHPAQPVRKFLAQHSLTLVHNVLSSTINVQIKEVQISSNSLLFWI